MKRIIIVCLILAVLSPFLYGCKETGKEEFEYIDSNGTSFFDIEGKGVELWFNQWNMDIDEEGNIYGKISAFTIDGKVYQHGLGINGLTDDGKDLREFSLNCRIILFISGFPQLFSFLLLLSRKSYTRARLFHCQYV